MKVVVAPLDWGLGHATRCIPIITKLQNEGHEVIIATSGLALPLLKQEFSGLTFLALPSYKASYSKRLPFMLKVLLQTPFFLFVMWKEHRLLENFIRTNKVDRVISDNRYGCYSKQVKSIFITHQVTILMPQALKWLQGFVNFFNHQLIRRFDECWVPDFPDDRLTGKLTNARSLPVKFIGMLSRFTKSKHIVETKFDLLVLLSGPEPQRSVFEKLIVKQLRDYQGTVLVVRGLPGQTEALSTSLKNPYIQIENHLSAKQLQKAIESSALVVTRSGYTTVMDLFFLEKKVIFVPTPGQTEQEYLAHQLKERGIADFESQEKFQLIEMIETAQQYKGFSASHQEVDYLQACIERL